MAGVVRGRITVTIERSPFPCGPFPFDINQIHDEFAVENVEVAATSTLQLVGGVAPTIANITTIQFLLLYVDQAIKVGLDGVVAETSGFTLSAYKPLIFPGMSLTQLQIYNSAAVLSNVLVVIGGT